MKNTALKKEQKPFSMPEMQYHELNALSSTELRCLNESPRKLWLYRQGKKEVTDSMHFGTMFHMAILEPQKFLSTYVVEPDRMPDGRRAGSDIHRNTKEWKGFISEWQSQNPSKIQLSPDEFNTLRKMMNAVHANRKASELLKSGEKEMTALWTDDTGVACKARADLIGECLVDFKTTTAESPWEFERNCYQHLYHSQTAFYHKGFSLNGCDFKECYLIGVEKTKSSEANCYVMRVSRELLERGYEKNKRLMEIYLECEKKNNWPGFDEVYDLQIPANRLIDIEGE